MEVTKPHLSHTTKVRDTEILATDTRQQYREKIARITLDAMVQFVGLLDARGTVLEINHVALNAVGVALSEVEGRPFWTTFWWQVSEEINADLIRYIRRAAQGEFVRWDTPIYGRAGGNETIIIDASLAPVMDEQGKVVFICAEGRDITEKKAQEREIAQKNSDLQGLLERIREMDEVKTQFFANVSHELRTPLALIIGPAERLMNSGSTMSTEMQRDTAGTIVRNAKMLLKHVNDLLDISKLEAKKLKIELKETDVPELIRFIASHFEILADERRIDLLIETGPPMILAVDPAKLQRVLMNLLSNAFKFVPTGGSVRCRLERERNDLILSVEDSGPGIRPELRKVIFERFRQGDGATNRQFAGTGLGLAIAHEFVEMHKGTIEVLGSDLGGALFRVSLPANLSPIRENGMKQENGVMQENVEKQAMEPLLDQSTLDGLIEELRLPLTLPGAEEKAARLPKDGEERETILVVEDNPEMNKFIVQCLASEHDVITAFDGQEGLQKALVFRPALIISDIMMPGVSGVQMITELRQRSETSDTPILVLSAKADEELRIKLLKESVQDFVVKPFSERDLQARVQNLIAVRKSLKVMRAEKSIKLKVAEAQNIELESRYKKLSELFQKTPSFMAVLRGPDHVFDLANHAYLALIGHREVIGKPLIEALPEIKSQGFPDMLDRVLATREPLSGTGVPVLLQRGPGAAPEQRYVNFIYQPLLDEDNQVAGVFVEGNDVTEEFLAKQQLIENEERLKEQSVWLEQQVQDRTRALKELNQSLKLSNEDLQQFAHVASHDLKEPIRKIKTFSGRLKDEYQNLLPDKANVFLQKILRATDRAYSMIDGVLSYSSLASKNQPAETVDLNEVFISIEADLELLIHEKKAVLSIDMLPKLEGVPVLLYQLFYNLVNNSIKFSKQGEPPVIRVQYSPVNLEGGLFARIVLSDNGIGFDQEQAEKIFTTFIRLNSKDKYEGTGLGLALCKKIVQRHGGSIYAKGKENIGAEFTVLLPLT